jgi:transposase
VIEERIAHGRQEKTSFCIIDAQSVKNTDTAEEKGYDAGKKVSGIKRHIAVDTQGLPHAIAITTANVTDRSGALLAFSTHKPALSEVKNVLADNVYTGEPFAAAVQDMLGATVEIVKRNELHRFVVLPKRWVVERSFAWLEKCRRLWKNCERKLNTSLQFAVLAFLRLLLKR